LAKLSIVIVNWNSEQYLRECLPTVFNGARGLDYEVVVVDSASPGNAIDALATEFPSVRFIRSAENVGFGRANNLGYEFSSGELLLFLNPDTAVIGSALADMVRALEALPQAGILGCKLLNSDRSVQLSAIQPFPTILNQAFGIEWLQRKKPDCFLWRLDPLFARDGRTVQVPAVSGACLLIRRDVFEQVGHFSREYFMYAEDVDLCYKAALAGWQTWIATAPVVVHHGGGSSRQRPVSGWSAVVQQHAKYMFLKKFRGATYARVFSVSMGLVAAVRLALALMMAVVRPPVSDSQGARAAGAKWAAILKWSVGARESR
jgi:GT2 family glycosyltransferase